MTMERSRAILPTLLRGKADRVGNAPVDLRH
jgi:hypothetical protein